MSALVMSAHKVKSIRASKVKSYDGSNGKFFSFDLIIETEAGEQMIGLFSDDKDALEIKEVAK